MSFGEEGEGESDEREKRDVARRLRVEREKLHEALDAVETLKREKCELAGKVEEMASVRRELLAAKRDAQTWTLSQQTLTTKIRRMETEASAMKTQLGALLSKVSAYEDRERYERDAQSTSLGEREMLRRLEGADPKMALETLVRNACAKNKQMAAQQEEYNELMKSAREKEKIIKSLEARVESYRAGAVARNPTSAPLAGTSSAVLGGRANSKHSWGVEDPADFEDVDPTQPEAKKVKKMKSLRQGNDALMQMLAPKKQKSAPTVEIDDDDDVLADILNEVDARVEKKRRRSLTTSSRGAGSFLKSSPKALATADANGTYIKHGADGRGGRGKVIVARDGSTI